MSIDDIVLTVAAQPSGTDIAQAALEKAESYGAIDPAVTKLLHRVLLIVVHGTAVVTIFEDWSTMLGYKKDGQIGAYHIALGIMIVFGVVIGTANWVLAILADWYEEQDLHQFTCALPRPLAGDVGWCHVVLQPSSKCQCSQRCVHSRYVTPAEF